MRKSELAQNSMASSDLSSNAKKLLRINDFVAGVIYSNAQKIIIPADTMQGYLCDCWVIDLQNYQGQDSVLGLIGSGLITEPVRAENLGTPIGYVQLPLCDCSCSHDAHGEVQGLCFRLN